MAPAAPAPHSSPTHPSSPPPPAWPSLLVDVFCKVIDNFGDIGVCWRLAADLAARGHRVRLWCDDPRALQWLAPLGAPGVQVIPWHDPAPSHLHPPLPAPGDVVIEAFACDPPAAFVQAMAQAAHPPVWINLEYLSAEAWVERCHRLPSPQFHGPGAGLVKWFFHPGLTAATGGLVREPGLFDAQARFDCAAWWQSQGLQLRPGERLVTLFCYDNPALPQMLHWLGRQPTLLALTPGPAQQQVHGLPLPPLLRTQNLPWLSQTDFDHLLWSADLNLVRGEDSLVRAIWAGRPFLWQLYPQQDGAHRAKSAAFLTHFLAGFLAGFPHGTPTGPSGLERQCEEAGWVRDFRGLWGLWNNEPEASGAAPEGITPDLDVWAEQARRFRQRLADQPDLVTQLLQFVAERSPALARFAAHGPAPDASSGAHLNPASAS